MLLLLLVLLNAIGPHQVFTSHEECAHQFVTSVSARGTVTPVAGGCLLWHLVGLL